MVTREKSPTLGLTLVTREKSPTLGLPMVTREKSPTLGLPMVTREKLPTLGRPMVTRENSLTLKLIIIKIYITKIETIITRQCQMSVSSSIMPCTGEHLFSHAAIVIIFNKIESYIQIYSLFRSLFTAKIRIKEI